MKRNTYKYYNLVRKRNNNSETTFMCILEMSKYVKL